MSSQPGIACWIRAWRVLVVLGLFGSAALSAADVGDDIEVVPKISLGTLNGGVGAVDVTVKVYNLNKSEAFSISSIQGSCSCFKSADYSPEIPAGGSTEVTMHFDIARFVAEGAWEATGIVVGSFNGSQVAKPIEIKADFDVSSRAMFLPLRERVIFRPGDKDGLKRTSSVTIYVPRDFLVGAVVELRENPKGVRGVVEYLGKSSEDFGRFAALATVTLEIDGSEISGPVSRLRIPIRLKGSVIQRFDYEIDVTKMVN